MFDQTNFEKQAKRKRFFPAFLWAIIICVLSLMPSRNLTELRFDLLAPDKLAHVAVYALLSFLWLWGYKETNRKKVSIVLLGSIILGVLLEIAQYLFFPDRFFELYDILANVIGAIIGIIALFFYHKTLSVWIFQFLAVLFLALS